MISVGIDKIAFYIPKYKVNLADIAARDGVDQNKFFTGIGQQYFAMPSHDEDIVTMAANAAKPILTDADKAIIDTIILATESGIDQSKSAAIYVQQLLGITSNCRAIEFKQACYSATAAVKFACDHVVLNPEKKVLVIASDIAHYELYTAAEATQGAGAVAMLISANPRIASYEGIPGLFTQDVMDFWRPNQSSTPLVNGRLSTKIYLEASQAVWQDFAKQNTITFGEFAHYCYHLPFTKMANKAHQHLCKLNDTAFDDSKIASGMIYNRIVGNCYTASLYLGLCSILDNAPHLSNQQIAMMSYGSGCVAEFFHLNIQEHYAKALMSQYHQSLLANRDILSLSDYEFFWRRPDLISNDDVSNPIQTSGTFRFAGIHQHQRIYEK